MWISATATAFARRRSRPPTRAERYTKLRTPTRTVRIDRSDGRAGERQQRLGLLADRIRLAEPSYPPSRQAASADGRSEKRTGHGGVGVGVAAERDDVAEPGLERVEPQQRL